MAKPDEHPHSQSPNRGRRAWAALLFFAALTAAADTARAQVRIQHWDTAAGARVYFIETHAIPAIDVSVEFRAGSAWDADRRSGVAQLTVAMLQAGSAQFSEDQQSDRLAEIGAQLSESFDRDRAGFRLRTLSSVPERTRALETLAAMLQSPMFPQPAFERERARAIAEVTEADTRPDGAAERRFYALMYPNHPYGLTPTKESLSGIVRGDVEAFYRDRYRAKRAVVTLVGDLDRESARAVAEALTSRLPPGENDGPPLPRADPFGNGTEEKIERPSAQSHILVGMPALARDDPDYFSLYVGNYVLGGGGFVSRLYRELREKRGYAYSAYSYFFPLQAQGPFVLGLETRNDQAGEALAQARAVLDEFLKDGPTPQELAAAKRGIVGGFPLRIDSNRKLLDQVAMIGFYELPLDWLDRYSANVESVTLEGVRAAFARRIRPAELDTVVAGAAR
jgi:zinc protease